MTRWLRLLAMATFILAFAPQITAAATEPAPTREVPEAIIGGLRPIGCVRQGSELIILGMRLGDEQAGRQVVVTGLDNLHLVAEVTSWSPNQVKVTMPKDTLLEPGERYVLQIEDGNQKKVSNGMPFDLCLPIRPHIESILPNDCVAEGAPFSVFGSGFGDEQRHRQLIMIADGTPVPLAIESWSDTRIVTKMLQDVQLLPGASYNIGIQNGSGAWLEDPKTRVTLCE